MITTAAALNRRLADALGIEMTGPKFFWVWKLPDGTGIMEFNPATSTDDLRRYVLPEIERRGLTYDFLRSLLDAQQEPCWEKAWMDILTADPAVLAEAACVVLEESK